MNSTYVIPKQILTNLMLDTDFLYKNAINDSFEILESNIGCESGDFYEVGYTIKYHFQEDDALIFLYSMSLLNKQDNQTFSSEFLPYSNGKCFEISIDDRCNAVEGMTTQQLENFITEKVTYSHRLQLLAISQLNEKLAENLI